jgi:hypothetical protein
MMIYGLDTEILIETMFSTFTPFFISNTHYLYNEIYRKQQMACVTMFKIYVFVTL